MNQKQYKWEMYTKQLIILLIFVAIFTVPVVMLFKSGISLIWSGLFATFVYGWSYIFYREEIYPYKNSKSQEPLTWDEVQKKEKELLSRK